MSLNDFLKVNLPYGICQYKKGYWYAFNRDYLPLGFSEHHRFKPSEFDKYSEDYPLLTKYKGLTDRFVTKLVSSEEHINRNSDGSIDKIFLYDDATNPNLSSVNWTTYQKKLKLLSKLNVEHS